MGVKSRHLLGKLKSEDTANNIYEHLEIFANHMTTMLKIFFYINRDLTLAVQKPPSEQRCRRLAKRNSDDKLTNAHPGSGASGVGGVVSRAAGDSLMSNKTNDVLCRRGRQPALINNLATAKQQGFYLTLSYANQNKLARQLTSSDQAADRKVVDNAADSDDADHN